MPVKKIEAKIAVPFFAVVLLFGTGCSSHLFSFSSAASQPSEQLGVGDRLLVSIKDVDGISPATEFTPLIESDGCIGLPWADPIEVAGRDNAQAAQAIIRAYRAANLEESLNVTVRRIEFSNSPTTPRGLIRRGDRLKVRIFDLEAPGQTAVIESDVDGMGTLAVPRIGRVFIAGLSERDAARTVSERLKDASMLSNAVVEVLRE